LNVERILNNLSHEHTFAFVGIYNHVNILEVMSATPFTNSKYFIDTDFYISFPDC